jgi:hypothetical protein
MKNKERKAELLLLTKLNINGISTSKVRVFEGYQQCP